MRFIATLVLILAAATCGAAPAATAESPREYLLRSAASDFHEHGPDPAHFRHVRFGHIDSKDGSQLFLVCGEFQAKPASKDSEWVEFATIRTSAYEQWLGRQGGGYCGRPNTSWKAGDLSAELQKRVDALR